jgi:hypothetical protein
MAILLTEDEYNTIQALHTDVMAKIDNASPRLSTHYQKLAKLHADFLANEDGKRATRQKKQAARDDLERKRQTRSAAQLQAAQQRLQAAQSTQQGTPASGGQSTQSTGRGSKAS